MNPFYEQFKRDAVVGGGGGGIGDGDGVGDVYRSVLYQRGYGLGYDIDLGQTYGLGFSDGLMSLIRYALPMLKGGLQYLGKQAVSTAANIAQDAIEGKNVRDSAKEHISKAGEEILAKAPASITEAFIKPTGVKRKAVSQDSAGALVARARLPPPSKKFKRSNRIGKGLLNTYPALAKI